MYERDQIKGQMVGEGFAAGSCSNDKGAALGAVGGYVLGAKDADPWKHRSAGMKCNTCMWFAWKQPEPVAAMSQDSRRGDVGRCRRHAPTMGGYPVVFRSDWCGDHRLDENRA